MHKDMKKQRKEWFILPGGKIENMAKEHLTEESGFLAGT